MTAWLGAEKVTLKTPPEVDGFGDPKPGTGSERELDGCGITPIGTSEDSFRSSQTTGKYLGLLPVPMEDVSSKSTVVWRGREYAVDGKPMQWVFGDGEDAACQVTLRRST